MSTLGSWDNAADITPSNATVISPPLREVYIGVTGDLKVRNFTTQADVLLSAVPAGAKFQFGIDKVYATGTTASGLVGFW